MAFFRHVTSTVLLLALSASQVHGSICKYPGTSHWNSSTEIMPTHVFKDPTFWKHFKHQVKLRSWKCDFPPDILFKDVEEDAKLYEDDAIFRHRRLGAMRWVKNETQWVPLVLGAIQEIADESLGPYSRELQKLHMLETLVDFVEHINCFQTVAVVMASKGRTVKPLSQESSHIHDIDKLDPVMLVGYSEKFTDNQNTSVWNECVERHTHVNPHHQAHRMWHWGPCEGDTCPQCHELTDRALVEMVCDKVSRRVQKQLGGHVSGDMWNVDLSFFKGLPENWLDRAIEIIKEMQ